MNERAGEDDNRNVLQFLVGSDFRQHMPTFLLGQLHVQQDQVRRRGLGEFALTAEKLDRFLAIANQGHSALHVARFKGLHRDVGILQVVFDQEDFHSVHCISTHGSLPLLTSSMSTAMETFRGWIPTVLYYRKQKSRRGGTPKGIRPVGLLFNEPPGRAELLFT